MIMSIKKNPNYMEVNRLGYTNNLIKNMGSI